MREGNCGGRIEKMELIAVELRAEREGEGGYY
jgi:hypothetical protein